MRGELPVLVIDFLTGNLTIYITMLTFMYMSSVMCPPIHMIKINEPQLPWETAIIYHIGLDVKMKVTQCTGRVSANTRRHQLRWGDREWAYYMSCAHNSDVWP